MPIKKNNFERDLYRLIEKGDWLLQAILYECRPEEFKASVADRYGEENIENYIEKLPDFASDYQEWYSEAQALVKQTMPSRLNDFVGYYEYPRVRKEITFENYMVKDYLQGLVVTHDSGFEKKTIVETSAAIPEFRQQLNIVKAAKSTLSSTLMSLAATLQADLFDSEIDSATALAKAGFLRAAGAVCGVVIEKHLKQVCADQGVKLGRKKTTIAILNNALKDNGVISTADWRFVQYMGDIRNLCDHAGAQDPTKNQIIELIAGTQKIVKTFA